MHRSGRIIVMWVSRTEAHLTVSGGDGGDLVVRLDSVLERLLHAGASHLVADLHRLTGDDTEVLELLAATCHRLWARRGILEVRGLRHRLAFSPEVRAFPEVFGEVPGT